MKKAQESARSRRTDTWSEDLDRASEQAERELAELDHEIGHICDLVPQLRRLRT